MKNRYWLWMIFVWLISALEICNAQNGAPRIRIPRPHIPSKSTPADGTTSEGVLTSSTFPAPPVEEGLLNSWARASGVTSELSETTAVDSGDRTTIATAPTEIEPDPFAAVAVIGNSTEEPKSPEESTKAPEIEVTERTDGLTVSSAFTTPVVPSETPKLEPATSTAVPETKTPKVPLIARIPAILKGFGAAARGQSPMPVPTVSAVVSNWSAAAGVRGAPVILPTEANSETTEAAFEEDQQTTVFPDGITDPITSVAPHAEPEIPITTDRPYVLQSSTSGQVRPEIPTNNREDPSSRNVPTTQQVQPTVPAISQVQPNILANTVAAPNGSIPSQPRTSTLVIDYESGVTTATRAPVDIPIPETYPKSKIAFDPEQPRIVRVQSNDLRDGLPLPGLLVKVITEKKSAPRLTYKLAINHPGLDEALALVPPRGEGTTKVYLMVKDVQALITLFDRIDGAMKKIEFQLQAQLDDDPSANALLSVSLIKEPQAKLQFTKDRYEFMVSSNVTDGAELGAIQMEHAQLDVKYQVYGESVHFFSLQSDGRLLLRCPQPGTPCLKSNKQWTLIALAMKGQQKSQPVQIVIRTVSSMNAAAQLTCSPQSMHILNGELTRSLVCLASDPTSAPESLSVRITNDALRPFFTFQKLATSRWLMMKHADPRPGNYTLSVALLENAVVKARADIELVVEETDNGVKFLQNPYYLSLSYRNVRPGRILTKVSLATPVESPVLYYVTNGADTGFVRVNETTGDVTISRNDAVLKRWKENGINGGDNAVTAYTVVAVDAESGVQISTSTLLLAANLTDDAEDDGPLEFDRVLFSGQLTSDAPIGTEAAHLMLASYRMKAKFTILPHSVMFLDKMKRLVLKSKNPFEIQTDGRVILTSLLPDDRQLSSILFRVEARQLNASLFSTENVATAVVAIYLNPARRPAPNSRAQFLIPHSAPNETMVNVLLPESAPVGYVLAVVPALDPANGDLVLATTLGSKFNPWTPYFQYESHSGVLSLKKQINFESLPAESNPIILNLAAGNGSSIGLNITVMDENDNAPAFEQKTYTAYLPEDAPSGRVVFSMDFVDNDTSGNSFSFTLDGGNGNFQLRRSAKDEHKVELVVAPLARFDYEKGQRLYSLAVTVRDGLNSQDTASVFIHIQDSNDHSPRFLKSDYSAQVNEAQPIGSSVLKVSAVDEDKDDTVTYELVAEEEPSNLFSIDTHTGLIRIASWLVHRARPDPYPLRITATDGSRSTSVTVNVYVLESGAALADQRSSTSRLQFVQPPLGFVLSIPQTTAVGTLIYTAQAIDIRAQRQGQKPASSFGGTVYSLGRRTGSAGQDEDEMEMEEKSWLALDAYTGELRTSRALVEMEHATIHSIVLIARSAVDDENGNETIDDEQITHVSRLLQIRLERSHDHRPMFDRTQDSLPVVFAVPERADRGYTIGEVHARDAMLTEEDDRIENGDDDEQGGAKITYQTICGNEQGIFSLDKDSGRITLAKSIRESSASNWYQLCVLATSTDRNASKTLAPTIPPKNSPYQPRNLSMLDVRIRVELDEIEEAMDLKAMNLSKISLGTVAIADRRKTLEMEKLQATPSRMVYQLDRINFKSADQSEAREATRGIQVIGDTGQLSLDPALYAGPEGVYEVQLSVFKDDAERGYVDSLVHYVNVVRDSHKLKFVFDIPMSSLEAKQMSTYQKLIQAVRQASNGDLDLVLDSPAPQDNENKRSSACFHAVQNRTRLIDRLITLKRMEELSQALLPVYQATNVIDIQDCAAAIETASVKPVEMVLFVFTGSLSILAIITAAVYYFLVKRYNDSLPEEPQEPSPPLSDVSETPPPSPSNQLVPSKHTYEWKEQCIMDFR